MSQTSGQEVFPESLFEYQDENSLRASDGRSMRGSHGYFKDGPCATPETPSGKHVTPSRPYQGPYQDSPLGKWGQPSPTQVLSGVLPHTPSHSSTWQPPSTPLHSRGMFIDPRYSRSPSDHGIGREFRSPLRKWTNPEQLEKRKAFESKLGKRPFYFKGKNNVLSNFYPVDLKIFGRRFGSTEAAYQYCKAVVSEFWDVAEELVYATSGLVAKGIARKVPTMAKWDELKEKAMKVILEAKLEQCEPFRRFLDDNRYSYLVEDTDNAFWARGSDYQGKNVLGHMIMDIREQLSHREFNPNERQNRLNDFMKLVPRWPEEKPPSHSSRRLSWSPHSNQSLNNSNDTPYYESYNYRKRPSYLSVNYDFGRRHSEPIGYHGDDLRSRKRKRDYEKDEKDALTKEVKKGKEEPEQPTEVNHSTVSDEVLHGCSVTAECEMQTSEKKTVTMASNGNEDVEIKQEEVMEAEPTRKTRTPSETEEDQNRRPLENLLNKGSDLQKEQTSKKVKQLKSELKKQEAEEATNWCCTKAFSEYKWQKEESMKSEVSSRNKGRNSEDERKIISLIPMPSEGKYSGRLPVSDSKDLLRKRHSSTCDSSSDSSDSECDESPRSKKRKISLADVKHQSGKRSQSVTSKSSVDSRKKRTKKKTKKTRLPPKGRPRTSSESDTSVVSERDKNNFGKRKKKADVNKMRKKSREQRYSSSLSSSSSSDQERKVEPRRKKNKDRDSYLSKTDKRPVPSSDSESDKRPKKKKKRRSYSPKDSREKRGLSDSESDQDERQRKRHKDSPDSRKEKRNLSDSDSDPQRVSKNKKQKLHKNSCTSSIEKGKRSNADLAEQPKKKLKRRSDSVAGENRKRRPSYSESDQEKQSQKKRKKRRDSPASERGKCRELDHEKELKRKKKIQETLPVIDRDKRNASGDIDSVRSKRPKVAKQSKDSLISETGKRQDSHASERVKRYQSESDLTHDKYSKKKDISSAERDKPCRSEPNERILRKDSSHKRENSLSGESQCSPQKSEKKDSGRKLESESRCRSNSGSIRTSETPTSKSSSGSHSQNQAHCCACHVCKCSCHHVEKTLGKGTEVNKK